MPDNIYLKHRLTPQQGEGLSCLACIAWPDPLGDLGFRAFFANGTDADAFTVGPASGGASISNRYSVNNGLILAGSAPSGQGLTLPLANGSSLDLQVTRPDLTLFEGLNTCIAERNGQPIEVVEAWLRYHVEHHNLQGVVLIDRAPSGQEKGFSKKLKKLSRNSDLSRILHLKSDAPLGAPDAPPAAHPFNAPDAPGRERMTDLEPDPWRSPFATFTLYELLRAQYLARARAVMNLDVSDLLPIGQNPFDKAHASVGGVISLVGRRIYPWRVRDGAHPAFGDHICCQFEPARLSRRWCVAPARLAPDNIWRLVRIVGAELGADDVMPFDRAMSILHPEASISEVVPKTSLVEDAALLEKAQTTFGHNPVRAPVSEMAKVAPAATEGGRTCIITTMKNEGPFILEWLAFHKAIGVEDFLVYSNDCTDGTDDLLDLLMAKGHLQHRDNPFRETEMRPQHAALHAANDEPMVQDAGWLICMDVDEYINIHVGEGRLQDLYEAVGDANLISLTWRLFGNANVHAYDDSFITDQFTRCAPQLCRKPHQAWGVKTLYRNIGIYKKLGVHRPKGLRPDLWEEINWVNGSGKPMPPKMLRNGWRSTVDSYGYDFVTLNHYAVRSAESFLVKRDRGRVNHVERDQGLSYWFRMNNNVEQDASVQTKRALLLAEYNRLMDDPDIRAAHELCVERHRAKIAELRATDHYEAFYSDLTGQRMERLSQLHNHFGANVFLAGPEVVPDEIVSREDLPADFFFTVEKTDTTH